MRKYICSFLSLALSACLMLAGALPAFANESVNEYTSASSKSISSETGNVYVVLAPYLTWDDVTEDKTPNLYALANDGSIANVASKSRGRLSGQTTSPSELALTVSSGYWAAAANRDSLAAYNSTEAYEFDTAGDAYERLVGAKVAMNKIVYLGYPSAMRANADSSGVQLGTLGQSIVDAGGMTVAIGNSDTGYIEGTVSESRPAALLAMDSNGRVNLGDVSSTLLCNDTEYPFGIRTNRTVFKSTLEENIETVASNNTSGLFVLDPGDSYRANEFVSLMSSSTANEYIDNGFATLDALVGVTRNLMNDNDTLIVVGSCAFGESSTEGLAPLFVYSKDYAGGNILVSSSTHRDGIVTAMDVTQLIYDEFDIESPSNVSGNSMTVVATDSNAESNINTLDTLNTEIIAINLNKGTIQITFIIITVVCICIALVLLLLANKKPTRGLRIFLNVLRMVFLFILSFPLGSITLLIFCVPQTGAEAFGTTLCLATLYFIISVALWRIFNSKIAIAVLMLTTSCVLIVDQFLGAPWSLSGLFSYSPILAARFYGLGNEAASILFGSALTGSALLYDEFARAKHIKVIKNVTLAIIAVLVLVAAAAPMFGANVGVIIWGIVGFAIAFVMMNGKKVTWKHVVLGILVLAVCLGCFIIYDLYASSSPSHLGQSIMSAQQGGLSELGIIIVRKVVMNLKVLTTTNWALVLAGIIIFLTVMGLKGDKTFKYIMRAYPCTRAALWASLFAGITASFTEDSGIVIPALVFLYMGIGIIWLMLVKLNDDFFDTDYMPLSVFKGTKKAVHEAEKYEPIILPEHVINWRVKAKDPAIVYKEETESDAEGEEQ